MSVGVAIALCIYTFVVGFMLGFITQYKIADTQSKRLKKKVENFVEKLKKDLSLNIPEEVLNKLKEAQEIEQEQLNMLYATEGPQRGILDGRNRQSISHQLEKLNEKKKSILTSILNSGYDPDINVIIEGKRVSMKLSKYMKTEHELEEESKNKTSKQEPKHKTKLTLVKNEDQ